MFSSYAPTQSFSLTSSFAALRRETVTKEGWCTKRAVSARFFKTWKDRFVVLRQSGISWHHEPGLPALGFLELNAHSTVLRVCQLPCTFVVQSGFRQLMVQAWSDLDMKKWILAISETITSWQRPKDPYYRPNLPGHTFESKYKKGGRLGNGAFGQVFECERYADGKKFAMKEISRAKMLEMDSPCLLRSVKWEVSVVMDIAHAHIAQYEEFFKDKGGDTIMLVSELCEGGELYHQVKNHGPYSEDKSKIVMRKILEAIAFCHSTKIIHRDIKLENIMLASATDDTSVKLIDFGLARPPANIRSQMSFAGTSGNYAPEMMDKDATGYHDRLCPEKVDIWQCGIVAHAILCARHPFLHKNPTVMEHLIFKGLFDTTNKYWSGISKSGQDFIRSALTVDVLSRPSANALLQHPWLASLGNPDAVRFKRSKARFSAGTFVY
jgi:serine/threonine protein kinase